MILCLPFVLNAAALSKPHAVQQLAADLVSYDQWSNYTIIYEGAGNYGERQRA